MTPEEINTLIDQATTSLINDSLEQTVECLEQLAIECSRAGKEGQQIFNHVRKLVVVGAIAATSKMHILNKLNHVNNLARKKQNARKEKSKSCADGNQDGLQRLH